MDSVNQTVKSYDKSADLYETEADKRGVRTKDIKKTFSYLKGKKEPVVVELGCAHGRDAQEIVKHTPKYFGMDASEQLVKKARRKLPGYNFAIATFEDYKFPQNVDAIFAFASLLHANEDIFRLVLNRSSQVLNRGGVFFISLQETEYKERFKKDEMGKRMFYYYSPNDVRAMKPSDLKEVFVEQYNLRDKKWFNVILQKS